jgi:hypothetical protein
LFKEETREGTGKESAKKLAKLGKRCAPIGVAVVVAGSLPGRSPVALPDPTPKHRIDGKLEPGKGDPGKGCGNN